MLSMYRARVSPTALMICGSYLHSASEFREYYPVKGVGGNGQSCGSTFSKATVRSWLRSTATVSCTLGYFSSITANSNVDK